jgi:hypothetical protein
MEYLMTYGWAILIIAVVLGVLFSLGVFSGSSLLGTSCVAYAGYYCASPIMLISAGNSNYAQLVVNLGQNTGSSFSNAAAGPILIECGNQTTTPSSNGQGWATAPTVASVGNFLTGAGWASPISTWSSGQVINNVYMVCAGSGALGASPIVGTSFTGFVWLVYSTTGSYATGANVITKLATVSVKVS